MIGFLYFMGSVAFLTFVYLMEADPVRITRRYRIICRKCDRAFLNVEMFEEEEQARYEHECRKSPGSMCSACTS
jgi:hypothetical protein